MKTRNATALEFEGLVQLLFALDEFQIAWAYFSLSDGNLYPIACHRALAALLDQAFGDPGAKAVWDAVPEDPMLPRAALLQCLRDFSEDRDADARQRLLLHHVSVQAYFSSFKSLLCARLGWPAPAFKPDGGEMLFRQSIIRWQAHIPTVFLVSMLDAPRILEEASQSQTIAVIGDIRRSLDLMTYAVDSASFAANMVRFVNRTRGLLDNYLGVFDKFTGDGFVAYFNEALCNKQGQDYRVCFLNFVREIMAFSEEHFRQWTSTVRKLPDAPVGLSIGADIGCVLFQDIESHFIAVGDPIPWAERVLSVGKAGEVVLNNLLYTELKDVTLPDGQSPDAAEFFCEPREGVTKTGERFLARVMRWDGSFSRVCGEQGAASPDRGPES